MSVSVSRTSNVYRGEDEDVPSSDNNTQPAKTPRQALITKLSRTLDRVIREVESPEIRKRMSIVDMLEKKVGFL